MIMERYITSTRDMDAIEAAITAQLKGENHRCAFLRSQSYLMLRIAALYKAEPTPYTVYHEGVSVSLDWNSSGKRVILRSLDQMVYNTEEDDFTPSNPEWESRKNPRLSAL